MSKKLVKFNQSGFYNIRGKATDVKGLEFPLIEDWKVGSDMSVSYTHLTLPTILRV